jgi:hypothetical protein
MSRTTFSVRSVSMSDVRFGQAIQRPALIARVTDSNRFSRSRADVVNQIVRSRLPRAPLRSSTAAGREPSVFWNPAGAETRATTDPSLTPSFCGSGVPE